MKAEIAIVGGGLAGWALAEALLRQGVDPAQMLLLEARVTGAGASGLPLGLLHPFPGRSLYPRPGYLAAWRQSQSWLSRLSTSDAGRLFQSLPLWRLAFDPATAGRFERSYLRALAELSDYPLLSLSDTGVLTALTGFCLPDAALVDMPRLLARLRSCAPIQTRSHSGPLQLQRRGRDWVLQSDSNSCLASQVVLAVGCGLNVYFPELPLIPDRGEIAIFDLDAELPAAVSAAGQYLAPLGAGRMITGSTHYRAECALPPGQAWQTLRAGLDWLPGIRSARLIQIWTGTRLGSQDREPLVGAVPGQPGLWLLGAFATRGLLQIPTAAEALAQELLRAEVWIPEAMRAERFDAALWALTD
ncbi:MAG: hypothetical protein CVV27_03445 [Candidatus Melainabacteria bacterium HGW-Melainabacteria-1]|nr:MAG: hypothetical protein CVV27_03445 [Candidatus Melainabacteria bacterium HGW-Melainabacteria-1]